MGRARAMRRAGRRAGRERDKVVVRRRKVAGRRVLGCIFFCFGQGGLLEKYGEGVFGGFVGGECVEE